MPTHFGQILDPSQVPVPIPQAPGQAQGQITQGPPVNQQDREQRVSGWTKVLENLKNDPSIQQMLIQAGSTLLQGRRPGESTGGVLGRALQGGNLAAQFINQNQFRAGQEQQRLDLEAERVGITGDLAEGTLATGVESRLTSKQTREQGKEAFPSIQAKRKAETKASQAETIIKEIEAENAGKKSVASLRLINAQADAEEQLAEFRKRSKPTESQTQTLYRAYIEANPNMSLQDVADKFIAHLGLKDLSSMITAAGRIATDLTVPPAERKVFKDWVENALPKKKKQPPVSDFRKPLSPQESRGKIRGPGGAPVGGGSLPEINTLADWQALPWGAKYIHPTKGEVTKTKPL